MFRADCRFAFAPCTGRCMRSLGSTKHDSKNPETSDYVWASLFIIHNIITRHCSTSSTSWTKTVQSHATFIFLCQYGEVSGPEHPSIHTLEFSRLLMKICSWHIKSPSFFTSGHDHRPNSQHQRQSLELSISVTVKWAVESASHRRLQTSPERSLADRNTLNENGKRMFWCFLWLKVFDFTAVFFGVCVFFVSAWEIAEVG